MMMKGSLRISQLLDVSGKSGGRQFEEGAHGPVEVRPAEEHGQVRVTSQTLHAGDLSEIHHHSPICQKISSS